jgi:glycosyltransferase involved in cell wall biosynthesis
MRILALTKYGPLAASTRQRFLQYRPWLEANGVTLDVAPLLGEGRLARIGGAKARGDGPLGLARLYWDRLTNVRRARNYDLLWIQYELFPYLPGLFERLAGLARVPIVVDYDDAIFHNYDRHRRPIARALLGRKLEPLLKRAAACICGNEYLLDYARRFCPASVLIPTVLDTDRFAPAPAPPTSPRVGWIGTPTNWQNVEPLLPFILPEIQRHGAVLRAIGAGAGARPAPGLELVDWREEDELAELQAMSVGIMPLLDEPFQRGKCGYKLIQYMACGVPVVASPVGVNAGIVGDRGSGLLADNPATWVAALDRLLSDPALRATMGAAGRATAVDKFSLAAHQPRLLRILLDAAQGRPASATARAGRV